MGGFAVDNTSLTRFFTLHFLLPFSIVGVRGLHLFFLHLRGSSNPLGIVLNSDKVKFNPYFSWKDLLGAIFVIQVLLGIVIALVASVAIYYRMPFINSSMSKSKLFLPLNKSLFWFLVAVIVLLTWIGARPVENPYIITGQLLTVLYFRWFMPNSRALRC